MPLSVLAQDAFSAIEALLTATGAEGTNCDRRASSMEVTFPGGMEVRIFDEGTELMVSCERWHTHCDEPDEAAWCVRWLMTPFSRIVHELKGGILAAVWVERYGASGWEAFDPVYFLNPEYPPEWELEPGQRWFRREYCQAAVPFTTDIAAVLPGAELAGGLPLDWHAEPTTVEAQSSQGLLLFEAE